MYAENQYVDIHDIAAAAYAQHTSRRAHIFYTIITSDTAWLHVTIFYTAAYSKYRDAYRAICHSSKCLGILIICISSYKHKLIINYIFI